MGNSRKKKLMIELEKREQETSYNFKCDSWTAMDNFNGIAH